MSTSKLCYTTHHNRMTWGPKKIQIVMRRAIRKNPVKIGETVFVL